MGQSKSSRRRRRKRKGKSLDGVAASGNAPTGEASHGESGQSGASASHSDSSSQAAPNPSNQGRQQNFQGGQQQNGNGTKRWKKKFRERDRPRSNDNIGNQAGSGNGGSNGAPRDRDSHQFGNVANGFKRKSGGGGKQQRGPRSFVGPMDHSYRVVNGNFADAPPSTIEAHGNYQPRTDGRTYQGDSQPIDYSQGRAIPIPEDAPTKIFLFIDDLFFVAKIQETARKLGVKVEFVKNEKEVIAASSVAKRQIVPA